MYVVGGTEKESNPRGHYAVECWHRFRLCSISQSIIVFIKQGGPVASDVARSQTFQENQSSTLSGIST